MKLFVFVALAFSLCAAYEKDGDVLVLHDDDIGDALKEFEFLLVEFYAPWCGHCKNLAPEYAKAATTLAGLDTPIPIAKVDATEETKSAGEYEVRGYPTLKFFVNGEATEYTGGRSAETIVQWVKKKTGPPCAVLDSTDVAESFRDGADVTVIAFVGGDSDEFTQAESAARTIEDVEFGVVSDAEVAGSLDASIPSLVLYKKFDEGKAVFDGEFTAEAISEFVKGNSVPLVSVFSQESASKIFGSGIDNHFLYFNSADSDTHEAAMEQIRTVAGEFKGKTLFVFVPSSEDRVMSYFDLTAADLPAAVLVAMGEGDMKKFAFEQDLEADAIRSHVQAFHAGELKPTMKSEDPPADNSGPVTVVVGSTFQDIVLDESKDVLLEFYAPWCGHCKALTPTYDELGEKFADKDSIVIAKVDATANDIDHPKVSVKGFPTILFFPADAKDAPKTYEGARELDAFVEYINKHATTLGDEEAAADDKGKEEL